tara:strand:- start:2864 stop:3010 length:147 start_codon:yes stop_codon:yes gene_type:complete
MRVILFVGEGSSEYYVPEKMYARFQKELMEYHRKRKQKNSVPVKEESK